MMLDVVFRNMKTISRSLISLAFIIVAGCATTQPATHWHPTPEGIDPAVFACVLSRIELHDATIEEAIALLTASWSEALDGAQLPVIVAVDYADRDQDGKKDDLYEGYPGFRQNLNVTAVDITVAECLDIIDACSPHRLTIQPGFLKFEYRHWIEEDWVMTRIPVSNASRQALGLSKKTTSTELRSILASLSFPSILIS